MVCASEQKVDSSKMRKFILCLVIALSFTGCCALSESDEALLREIRSTLVESTRPALTDALDNAKKDDGSPLYIDAYRDERVNTVDTMVEAIDRVYPAVDDSGNPEPYEREPLPWKD